MTIRFASIGRIPAKETGLTPKEVRNLIAEHLGVEVERVTDEARFIDDLGADWLDCLELIMAIEEHFSGLEIIEEDVEQIQVVGDLIHYIENASQKSKEAR